MDIENNLLSSTASVIIHILDANDNKPVFPQEVYYATIKEDAPPRTNIIRITVLSFISMNYRDFSVKSKLIISLFQIVKFSL